MKPSTTIHHRHPPATTHFSDSDSSDSSDSPKPHHHTDFSNTIFQSYIQFSNVKSPDLTKIQSFLTSSRSGALSCLICLERIRPTDPTWSCTSRCFAVFHLVCIQSWARQSSDLSSLRAATRGADDSSSTWNCPKCRIEFPKTLIPKTYTCFCGKVENPCHDPWVLPHSCGEICNRPLKYDCGHKCLLLCHPGPCPSCPKLVKARCFCGGVEDVKRCGFKEFSCKKTCSNLLDCKVHCCVEICHDGKCPPCKARGVYECRCGKVKEEKECFERDFRCEIECEKLLGCGKHVCHKGCHEGECGDCQLQGKRTCPCGKQVYEGMACDVVVPSCGGTCDKKLQCGFHRCPERCHRGNCVETCRIVITKSCKCGSLRKQVPCYQDLVCERKCQQVRDCGRHACKRRCCDGDCPPCSEICDKRLRCRNHKCPSPCHRGACAPCPVMVTISCFCGQTRFEVPCGTEKEQKPPKCSKHCEITPLCRHKSITKPHKCHYGACSPCRLVCDEEYPCGHKCKLRCHGPIPSPNPEFSLRPKKKKQYLQSESTPGSTCPPCPELVWRSCVGEHIGAERMMVCSNKAKFSCDNYCGNPLPCGNHFCTKTCHSLMVQCEGCNLPCQRIMLERDAGRSRGFGFLTFSDRRGMEDAIREMHGSDFGERVISVNKARPRMCGEDQNRGYGGSYPSGGRGGYGGGDRSLGQEECFKCGRSGHWACDCPSAGAIREMHDSDFGERVISDNKARPRMRSEDQNRGYGGGYPSGGRGGYGGGDRSLGQEECFKCGRSGHWACDCPSAGAIREMHGSDFGERVISVNKARPRMCGEDQNRGYGGSYPSGGRGGYGGGDRSLGQGECFKCGRSGHWACDCPSAGGAGGRGGSQFSTHSWFNGAFGRRGSYLDREHYGDDRYDAVRFGDRDRYGVSQFSSDSWFNGASGRGDHYPDREHYGDDRYDAGWFGDRDRYGGSQFSSHSWFNGASGHGDRYPDHEHYVDDRYDAGRSGYRDRYDSRDSKYGSRSRYDNDRYPASGDPFVGDRYAAPDRYLSPPSVYGRERDYDRDVSPRRSSDRYSDAAGPELYEGRNYGDREGLYDHPRRGGGRPSSFDY